MGMPCLIAKRLSFFRSRALILVSALIGLSPFTGVAIANAHPHAAIELRSEVVFDASGKLSEIAIEWLFDDMYSAYATSTLDRGDSVRLQKSLDGLARRNLDNLAEYDYFIDLRVDGSRKGFSFVREYSTGLRAGRLWLRFSAALRSPEDPRAKAISYAVYDPTYYIEILYPSGERVPQKGTAPLGCRTQIRPPEGHSEAKAFANALGPNETPDSKIVETFSGKKGTSLGELFAETTVILCD